MFPRILILPFSYMIFRTWYPRRSPDENTEENETKCFIVAILFCFFFISSFNDLTIIHINLDLCFWSGARDLIEKRNKKKSILIYEILLFNLHHFSIGGLNGWISESTKKFKTWITNDSNQYIHMYVFVFIFLFYVCVLRIIERKIFLFKPKNDLVKISDACKYDEWKIKNGYS